MVRVCFSMIVLIIFLSACETEQQPPPPVNNSWNPLIESAEKEDTSDCLRKTNAIEALACVSKN